jgi:transposase
MARVDFHVPSRLPETLCIDEFKGSSGAWDPDRERWSVEKFHCNIADGDAGCVFDVLKETDNQSLYAYFSAFPPAIRQEVRYFCCDMHGGYITLAKRCFPQAAVCVDMFHVIKLLNDNVDDIRRSLQNRLRQEGREDEYALLKHSMHILRTAIDNQPSLWGDRLDAGRQRLKSVLSLSDELREAYDALQDFHFILCMSHFNFQRAELSDWIRKYQSSYCPGTRRCVNTIRHHRSYIQNSWRFGKSNGPCEGLNKRIKDIKRNGYGVHSFENFRRRILFACGYSRFVEESFTIAAEKKTRLKDPV